MEEWLTAERLDAIESALRQRVSPNRVTHTTGACHTAVHLAQRWDVDPAAALAAALFHDMLKEEDEETLGGRILGARGEMDPEDLCHWKIWHAVAGELVARDEFGMPSPEVGRAIRLHPTGDAEMTPLDQIVFLADFIEPTRTWEGVKELRELARFDLRAAVDSAILQKTSHIRGRGIPLHARSRRALDGVLSRMKGRAHDATVLLPTPIAEGKEEESD